MDIYPDSRHIVVLRRGQFCSFIPHVPLQPLMRILDWFDVLDDSNFPLLTEREVIRNLQAIINDADTTDQSQVLHHSTIKVLNLTQ
jgi:carnitine O-acetyltransferase